MVGRVLSQLKPLELFILSCGKARESRAPQALSYTYLFYQMSGITLHPRGARQMEPNCTRMDTWWTVRLQVPRGPALGQWRPTTHLF